MKSLMYRNNTVEFFIKYEDEDLDGLLAIAVDEGEIGIDDRDAIKEYIAKQEFFVSINHIIVFEVTDHDAERDPEDDEYDLGLPDSFEDEQ